MFGMVLTQKRWLELLMAMVEREIKLKYKFTKLGFYWIVLSPFIQMLTIGFIFQFLISSKIDNYFIFLFIGIVIWNYFSNTLSKNTNVIIDERSLIQKSNFPREIVVFSRIIVNLINFVASNLLLMIFLIINNKFKYQMWFLLPLATLNLINITTGFSFLLSSLNVKHRDIDLIITAILPLWFYGTPILYDLNMLPKELVLFFYINPLTSVVEIFRYIFLGLPVYSITACVIGLVVNFLMCIFGFIFFKSKSLDFNDYI